MNSIQSILITGNRKGIGRYLTEFYLDKGYGVYGCSRTKSDLKNKNYSHFECDVSRENDVIKTVKAIHKEIDSISVLINNAGIASLNHSVLTPAKTVKKVFGTNFNGSFYFTRECSKYMMKKNFGRIINFSTVAVPLDLDGEMIYASSKSAVEKMTKITAKELAKFNITVNALGPTPIDTDLTRTVPKNKIDEIIEKHTIKRLGKMEDISNVIEFFIKKESEFITGQIIYLGGL